jgi:pimeloyl-ACP methyl ester carboxylesterase
MPTPVVFDQQGVNPFATTPAVDCTTTGRVFIATVRGVSGKTNKPSDFYLDTPGHGLRVGVAEVNLARDMTWEELVEESRLEKRTRKPRQALLSVSDYGVLWSDLKRLPFDGSVDQKVRSRLLDEVNAQLAQSQQKDIFVFAHGFNTTFEGNATVAAELRHYLGADSVFISYAWPSRGKLLAYGKDKATARDSTRSFRLFLQFLADNTDARKIHLIGHSAGAPVVVEGLRQIRLIHWNDKVEAIHQRYRIGRLVLVAPDMDLAHSHNAYLDGAYDVPETTVLYYSTRDRALHLSGWIFGDVRLGDPAGVLGPSEMKSLEEARTTEIIDVAAAEKDHGSWLGHSYFHNDPWVSADLMLLLRHGADPATRGLVREQGSAIWTFPKDYPGRAQACARTLYGQ